MELKNQWSVCGFFCYFNFERNYYVLTSKSPVILLNKNINFNKNKTELKMKNPTHGFGETSLALQLILKSQIKSKTVMSWSSQTKKEDNICTVSFARRKFFNIFFISMYSVMNTLSEYAVFYISKNITLYTFLLVFIHEGSDLFIHNIFKYFR